jgi:hypothetical protein
MRSYQWAQHDKSNAKENSSGIQFEDSVAIIDGTSKTGNIEAKLQKLTRFVTL